jgi:hypothetical protein
VSALDELKRWCLGSEPERVEISRRWGDNDYQPGWWPPGALYTAAIADLRRADPALDEATAYNAVHDAARDWFAESAATERQRGAAAIAAATGDNLTPLQREKLPKVPHAKAEVRRRWRRLSVKRLAEILEMDRGQLQQWVDDGLVTLD